MQLGIFRIYFSFLGLAGSNNLDVWGDVFLTFACLPLGWLWFCVVALIAISALSLVFIIFMVISEKLALIGYFI